MFKNRFSLLPVLISVFILISMCCRTALLISSLKQIDLNLFSLIKIYTIGLLYDFIASSYFFIPFTIYLILIPAKLFKSIIFKIFTSALILFQIYIIIFSGFSEWFFWDEFGKRFNFIAVDYLVYTHEVIHNILESYPIPFMLTVIFFISLLIFFLIYKNLPFFKKSFTYNCGFFERVKKGAVFLLLPLLFFYIFDGQSLSKVSSNQFNNELAKNGIYSIFSAFRHNTLDYDEFYKTLNIKTVMNRLRQLIGFNENNEKFVKNEGKELKYNVELIMVESLSAEYMGALGDKRGYTPHLDNITKHSLFFKNFYAVGTRTVRGMEAVVLSVPPTPGRSIVKRPDCHNMFSAGFIFKEKGYENKFIYAGYGYFDNMNDFFSHNGFKIVDRSDFNKKEKTFGNVWGLCDEDLFNKVLKESDKSYKKGKPFFNFIMTTSNHRPYTYPNGKIDIPSHTGRSGAVKYTDYAINKFLRDAESKPWFKNTIFIIVADHNAHSAGKTSLPTRRYKIPLIIYAPEIIKPKVNNKLASQVDIMPTLFSILNWSYKSKFYGDNILSGKFHERAFIGNYQKLGLFRNRNLTILTPNKKVIEYHVVNQNLYNVKYKKIKPMKQDVIDTITYYQSASYMYKHKLDRWK